MIETTHAFGTHLGGWANHVIVLDCLQPTSLCNPNYYSEKKVRILSQDLQRSIVKIVKT